MKMFEYMAAGKAIICSDLPVLHEVLQHNRNCLLCSPNSIDEWMDALLVLRDDIVLREKLGGNAQKDWAAQYTWTSRAQNILKKHGFVI